MTNKKIILAAAVLLVFVLAFGCGTCAFALESEETRYADAPTYSTRSTETINYTRKEIVEENYTYGDCPMFTGLSELSNECGAIAGAEIVAFYDRYFTELIPGWTPYYTANNKYRRQDSTYVPALIRDLYTRMRTNVDDVGVSESDFLNGLTSYFNAKGRQISYTNVKSGSTLNYAMCKNAIDNNKVIALLTLPTSVYEIVYSSNYDTVLATNIAGAHIMVIYGYFKINYYNANGLFRSETYVRVSVGRDSILSGLYKVNSATTNAAYIVNVQ